MQILIDATGIVNKMTGVGRYSQQLLTAIANIDQDNSYTILLQQALRTDHPIWALRDKPNFNLKRVDIPAVGPKKQICFPWAVRKAIKTKADLIHSLNSELPLLHNLKSVVTIHDLKYLKFPAFFRGLARTKTRYLKHIFKIGCQKASKVITVSESTKGDIINLLGIKEEKICVIYEAADSTFCLDENSSFDSEILKQYSITKPYFLYVGEIRPHKNLEGLIEAFSIFKYKYNEEETQLVITGQEYSDYKGPLLRADELKIKGSLVVTGPVPNSHLKVLYREAEVFLLVSFYEGFGLPILEAMQYGIPVITSNVSSMPEVAGNAALLVNPYEPEEIAEAMNCIRNSEHLKMQLVRKGIVQAKNFSWERTAKKTLGVYDDVLNK